MQHGQFISGGTLRYLLFAAVLIGALSSIIFAQIAQVQDDDTFRSISLQDVHSIETKQISSTSFSLDLAGDPIADFEVKNPIGPGNRLLDCTGGLTCDFKILLTPKIAIQMGQDDISGGWKDGTAHVSKIFYNTLKPIAYFNTEGKIAYWQMPYEETDLTTLQKYPDEPIEISIRFSRDTVKQVDIYPVIFGHSFTQFSIWGTGGTEYNITVNGTIYAVHVFTSNSTFNVSIPISNAQILAIGGGGGGGTSNGGGGGAGGFVIISNQTIPVASYPVTVGSGGAANTNGTNSLVWNITAIGGGGSSGQDQNGKSGGSGGAAGSNTGIGGVFTGGTGRQPTDTPTGFGNNGGGTPGNSNSPTGGGGGAGAVGETGHGSGAGAIGGNGGVGLNNSINGSAVCYAGGGAGTSGVTAGNESGHCGGGNVSQVGTNGKGGGGGSNAAGGSGIVIISYPFPVTVTQVPTITPTVAFVTTTVGFNVAYLGDNSVNVTSINWTIYQNGSSWATGTRTGNFSVTGVNTSLANFSGFARGSTIILGVNGTLSNGSIMSQTNSSTLIISNIDPVITNFVFTSNGTSFILGPVQANTTVSDTDINTTLTLFWNWFKNGVNQTGLASSHTVLNGTTYVVNLTGAPFTVEDNWSIQVWVNDGTSSSAITSSANTTIQPYLTNEAAFTQALQTGQVYYPHFFNATMNGGVDLNVQLNISGTFYNVTKVNASPDYRFNSTVRAPITQTTAQYNGTWIATTTLANGTNYTQYYNYTFLVSPTNALVICNAVQNTVSLVYQFFDEDTFLPINVTFLGTYNYITNDTPTTSGLSETNFTVYGCIVPSDSIFTTAATELLAAPGYASRTVHSNPIASNSTQTFFRYLLNSSNAVQYTFHVINQYNTPVQNATVEFYYYDPNLLVYQMVDRQYSDFAGYFTVSLFPGHTYLVNATAVGHQATPNPFFYTPGNVTSQDLRMYSNNSQFIQPLPPNYEIIWRDIGINISPFEYFQPHPFNMSFSINGSNITYYGASVDIIVNGSPYRLYFENISGGSSVEATLIYQVNDTGRYIFTIFFKADDLTQPYTTFRTYTLGNYSGLSEVRRLLETEGNGIISNWGYIFLATVVSMLVAGYVSRFTLEGAGIIGLLIFIAFAILHPSAVIYIGIVPIYIWMIVGLSTIGLIAGLALMRGF